MPVRLLEALRDRGYLRSNTEAAIQYKNLVFLKVGHLLKTASNWSEFHLNKTDENKKALDLAINLLKTGELSDLDVKQDARIALSKDEKYIQSVISAAKLKERDKVSLNEDTADQFEQLILAYE